MFNITIEKDKIEVHNSFASEIVKMSAKNEEYREITMTPNRTESWGNFADRVYTAVLRTDVKKVHLSNRMEIVAEDSWQKVKNEEGEVLKKFAKGHRGESKECVKFAIETWAALD